MLDSGASRNFIDEAYVQNNQLQTCIMNPIMVELADGHKKKVNSSVKINELKLDTYHTSGIDAQVLNIQCYDLILGKPWLYHANPTIDWRNNSMTFNYDNKVIKVIANNIAPTSSCNSLYVSRQQFAELPHNAELFAICTAEKE